MKATKALILILCITLLFSVYALPAALATESLTSTSDYDYSREGSYFNTTFTASDILESLGYTVSPGERVYLDEYGDLNVKYETVTNQQISVSTVDGDTIVTARAYSYVGSNGEQVVWTPQQATITGEYVAFTTEDNVTYVANLGAATLDDDSAVSVKYSMNAVTVSRDDVNRVIDLAYTEAGILKEEIELYTTNAAVISEYLNALALYEENRKELEIYDAKKEKYDEYVAEYALYESNTLRYNEYLAALEAYMYYEEYPSLLAKYNEEKAKYDQYINNLDLVEKQLEMLHTGLMGKSTYLERELYACFFANLVDEVVAQKDKLTKIGASKEDIEECAVASNNIREILKPTNGTHYVDLKTTEEKYAFYVNNHVALRDNIINLTCTLYSIYTTPGIKSTMHLASDILGREDYTERLAIFIAQLIYLSNALSDTPVTCDGKVLDANTKLSYRRLSDEKDFDNVKIFDLLADENGQIFIKDCGIATPVTIVKVDEPTAPAEPTVTVNPTPVERPVMPAAVANPGQRPEELTNPVRPACVPEDLSRLEIVDNGIYLDLVDDLVSGSLESGREELTEDYVYVPTVTLEKKINVTGIVEVTFVDYYGNPITTIGVDKDSAVNFTDALPTKSSDLAADYVFDAWVTEDGVAYNLSSAGESVTLYPTFNPVYKEYNRNGKYLDVPLGDFSFSDVPLSYFAQLAYNYSYSFNGINNQGVGLRFIDDGITVEIPFASVSDIKDDVASFDVNYSQNARYDYSLEIPLYGENGSLLELVTDFKVLLACDDVAFGQKCSVSSDNKKTYEDGTLKFEAKTSTENSISWKYTVKTTSNLGDKITVPAYSYPGDTVTIDIPVGMSANLYYIINGEKYAITDGTFVMPEGEITIGGSFTAIKYVVKFVNGDTVIQMGEYTYGTEITVPNNPTRINDEEYSYTFTGWSPEVSMTVTGDVIYVAQFEATPLPEVEEKISWFNVIFYTVVAVICLAFLGLIILILRKTKLIGRIVRLVKKLLGRGEELDSEEKAEEITEQTDVDENTEEKADNAEVEGE